VKEPAPPPEPLITGAAAGKLRWWRPLEEVRDEHQPLILPGERRGEPESPSPLEEFYGRLAQAIDSVGPEHEALLLCKLVLLLAHEVEDPVRATAQIDQALRDLAWMHET